MKVYEDSGTIYFLLKDVTILSGRLKVLENLFGTMDIIIACDSRRNYILMDEVRIYTNVTIEVNRELEVDDKLISNIVDIVYTKYISNKLYIYHDEILHFISKDVKCFKIKNDNYILNKITNLLK